MQRNEICWEKRIQTFNTNTTFQSQIFVTLPCIMSWHRVIWQKQVLWQVLLCTVREYNIGTVSKQGLGAVPARADQGLPHGSELLKPTPPDPPQDAGEPFSHAAGVSGNTYFKKGKMRKGDKKSEKQHREKPRSDKEKEILRSRAEISWRPWKTHVGIGLSWRIGFHEEYSHRSMGTVWGWRSSWVGVRLLCVYCNPCCATQWGIESGVKESVWALEWRVGELFHWLSLYLHLNLF